MDKKRDFVATPRAAATTPRAAATTPSATANDSKRPRTARGERTLKSLIDAAAIEFGEKGFHEASISGITSRAGVALGSFYTYFDSKDAIFRALVTAMSEQVRDHVAPVFADATDALSAERDALKMFLDFASAHREIYRIIDESEFVDPASFRRHYETTALRICERLQAASQLGSIRPGVGEVEAWAIMGMNVFLGLRFGVWDDAADHASVANTANRMIAHGIAAAPDVHHGKPE